MNKTCRLYNVIFPLWLLVIFPKVWIIVIPANLLIDFIVVWFSLHPLSRERKTQVVKKSLWKVVLCGFAADLIAAVGMILAMTADFGKWWYEHLSIAVYNPFDNIFGFFWAAGCVFIGAVLIYLFNVHLCLKGCDLSWQQKKKTALMMAVFTAPYLFLFPTMLLY